MLMSPPVLALNGVALLLSLLLLMAAAFAVQVLRHWDLASGSERQLRMERRTYLISTLVAFCFVAESLSLLLFIYNAEQMSGQFVGAMCATGVLNAAPWGWATLFLKIAVFFAGAAWLMLNHVDHQAYDYPLVKVKYRLLLLIVPLMIAEAVLQGRYFLALDPDVMTSCCGALFTPEGGGVAAEVTAIPPRLAMPALYASGLAMAAAAAYYLWRRRASAAFALLSVIAFLVALVAIVSALALYVYQHPHHHCPFCILKSGHHFIGYGLYGSLFGATALALGVGLIGHWRAWPSLQVAIAAAGRRFTLLALALLGLFHTVAAYAVLSSSLRMQGVWW
jgi:energy-converting hydrogenase Eha subunit C